MCLTFWSLTLTCEEPPIYHRHCQNIAPHLCTAPEPLFFVKHYIILVVIYLYSQTSSFCCLTFVESPCSQLCQQKATDLLLAKLFSTANINILFLHFFFHHFQQFLYFCYFSEWYFATVFC